MISRYVAGDVGPVDAHSGKNPSEYVSCSMTSGPFESRITFRGKLPDGTEEQIDFYTWEKIKDPKHYLWHLIKIIEEERGLETS